MAPSMTPYRDLRFFGKRGVYDDLLRALSDALGEPESGDANATRCWTVHRLGDVRGLDWKPPLVVLLRSMVNEPVERVAAEVILADPTLHGLEALSTLRVHGLDDIPPVLDTILSRAGLLRQTLNLS